MDSWSKEQVEVMKENGNIKSNDLYNPDEITHPPPTNMIDSERDSELEKYIRCEFTPVPSTSYLDRSWGSQIPVQVVRNTEIPSHRLVGAITLRFE